MGNFEHIQGIKNTGEKIQAVSDALAEIDKKNEVQGEELQRQTDELRAIFDNLSPEDKSRYSSILRKLGSKMIVIQLTGNYPSEKSGETHFNENNEGQRNYVSEVSVYGVNYSVGKSYVLTGTREFGINGIDTTLRGIYKYTKNDGTEGYKGIPAIGGEHYDLQYFSESQELNSIINQLETGNYSGSDVFTQNKRMFDYLYSNFLDSTVITDQMVANFKKVISEYASGAGYPLKEGFPLKKEENGSFTISEEYVQEDLGEENCLELTFG